MRKLPTHMAHRLLGGHKWARAKTRARARSMTRGGGGGQDISEE